MRARESAPASSVPSTRSLASTGRGYSCATRPVPLDGRRAAPSPLAAGAPVAEIETGPPQTSVASAAISCEACFASMRIGRATIRPASSRSSSALTGMSIGSRSSISSSGRIISVRSIVSFAARLHEQVAAADEVLRALVAELGDDLAHLLAHPGEEARAVLGGAARTPAA